ncbi:transposase [Klebsiella aerogenes]
MKLSFHQHIALFWMIGAPGVFAPVIENAKRPDAGAVMAWGVAIVAVMILFTPLLLRQALAERGLRRYYQTAFDDGYVPRVMPYVWRIIWTVGGLMAVTAVLPTNTGRPAFDALVVFSTWYPIGVMLLVFASRPLGRLIRQRAQERRK